MREYCSDSKYHRVMITITPSQEVPGIVSDFPKQNRHEQARISCQMEPGYSVGSLKTYREIIKKLCVKSLGKYFLPSLNERWAREFVAVNRDKAVFSKECTMCGFGTSRLFPLPRNYTRACLLNATLLIRGFSQKADIPRG